MATRGTTTRSKTEFSEEIENLGAIYNAHSDREFTTFGLQTFAGDASRGIAILGDILSNNSWNSSEFELLKDELSAEQEANHERYEETLLENAHFNSFREHMLGQPIKGDRDITRSIQLDNLRDYYTANYYGDNIIVVATGNVSHEQIVDQVNQHFSTIPKTTSVKANNAEKPIFIPGLLMIRDDEMYNSNVGVFYDAPSVKHEDFYAFKLLKHMFGNYRIDVNAEHLNDTNKQYNAMHALVGMLPDVTKINCHYFAYSDCGLWGNYFFGNEVFTRQMNYMGVHVASTYAHFVNDVECHRGRNHLFNELLTLETPQALNEEIGRQFLSVGRRISRTEVAKRVAYIDNYHIKGIANKWFYDAEPTWTNWGPIE